MAATNLIQLRQNLGNYFNKGELHTLCFDLGVDYENYSDRKSGLIEELILDLAGQGRLDELLEQCRKSRPRVAWPDIPPEEIGALLRPKVTKERRNQLILLDKIKRSWIDGYLTKAVRGAALIDLEERQESDVIHHEQPSSLGVRMADYDLKSLPENQKIIDIFHQAQRALLILGEPGSGKTITLLELARELITLAENDPTQPIPVILNLTSWVERRQALVEWVIEELMVLHHIPRKDGRAWLKNDDLLLLLDGFDEVPDKFRVDCVTRINQFRKTHGLVGIVVCSRIKEYEASGKRLRLDDAIIIQSLTAAQIEAYLDAAGPRLDSLRMALQQDAALREMAQSPLLLSVMSFAYSDNHDLDRSLAETVASASDVIEARRQHLFTAYVQRMFELDATDSDYPPEQTKQWLAWLARGMFCHNQSVFLIEQIQPSWLSTYHWRRFYLITTRLIDGFLIGLVAWMALQQGKLNTPELNFEIGREAIQLWQMSSGLANMLFVVIANLGLGLVVGIIDTFYFERRHSSEGSKTNVRDGWLHTAVVGLTTGLLGAALVMWIVDSTLALYAGVLEGIAFALFSHFIHGRNFRDEIRTVEALRWSWSDAIRGAIPGLVVGVIWGVAARPFFGLFPIFSVLFIGLLFLLFGGLRGHILEIKSRPNQGIWLSAQNGILAGSLVGIIFSLFISFRWGVLSGLIGGFYMGLATGVVYGGGNMAKHFYMRFLLWYKRRMPRSVAHFLDYASGLVFLHKLGGGYIFVHRLLQEYFADLPALDE